MWTLKLAGFSLAAIATEPLNLECGNEYYRAPEMTSGMGYEKFLLWYGTRHV